MAYPRGSAAVWTHGASVRVELEPPKASCARNLCVASLIEAVRDQLRCVDLKQVNRVLLQPHWREDADKPLP